MKAGVYNRLTPGYSVLGGLGDDISNINSWSGNNLFLQKSLRLPDAKIVDPKSSIIRPSPFRNYGNFRPASNSPTVRELNAPSTSYTPTSAEIEEAIRRADEVEEPVENVASNESDVVEESTARNPKVKWGYDSQGKGQYYLSNQERGSLSSPNLRGRSSQAYSALDGNAEEVSPLAGEAEAVESSSFDAGPLVLAGGMVDKLVFDTKASNAEARGTITGKVAAGNYTREGNDTSTGIVLGGTIGSLFDEYLGPIGTLAGAAIGGAIGGLVSTASDRSVNTTAGSASTDDPSLAF